MNRPSPRYLLWPTLFAVSSGLSAAPALEEVIVTAQKREELMQDVPISMAAFTETTLEKMGVQDISDMAGKVPNVYVKEFPSGGGTTIQMWIRGIGQADVQVTQDPAVAIYMDGVYMGTSTGNAFESADLQRVEVLRGPQGTLYGRNATGGAVNLITKQADPSGMYFNQRLVGGNLDTFRSRSIFNMPITDEMAVKLAYYHSEQDGLTENLGDGDDFGQQDRDTFTGDFYWGGADNMSADYKYERYTLNDTARMSQVVDYIPPGSPLLKFANPATVNGIPVDASSDFLDKATSYDPIQKGDQTINAHTAHYAWDISDALTLKSITGYRDLDSFYQVAQSPTTYLEFGGEQFSVTNALVDTKFDQFSQEFQLLGNTSQLEWVGGLFYYQDESKDNNFSNTFFSEAIPDGELVDYTDTQNTSIALYGQATWTPEQLERWHFTLGARYNDDNRKASRENSRVAYGIGGIPTGLPPFTAKYDQDFDEFNPAFTVQYDLNDFSNVYAKVVTAYKAGGTSQRSQIEESFQQGFDPENVTSYELGYKGDLMDGRLRLNGAVFYMDYQDFQLSVQTAQSLAGRDFINIDTADISGVEMDVSFAFTDQLIGTLSYGYLDTSFGPTTVSYRRQDSSAPDGFIIATDTLIDDLPLAPENSATASLDYNLPLSWATLNANINAQYQDDAYSSTLVPAAIQKDRTLLNASVGLLDIELRHDAGRLRVTLWGNNITDEEYFLSAITVPQFVSLGVGELATFGDPRTYGVTLEYTYE